MQGVADKAGISQLPQCARIPKAYTGTLVGVGAFYG